ncbi:hypothetical protein ABK040_005786 [Willaertia magna]
MPKEPREYTRIIYNPDKIDRSKRVAPGCEVDSKNIVKGTRRRKNLNYNVTEAFYNEGEFLKSKRKSKNTLETRAKTTVVPKKRSSEKKGEKKAKKQEESNKENVKNKNESENEENEQQQKEELPLSNEIVKMIKKLGGVVKIAKGTKKFHEHIMPQCIKMFADVDWRKDTKDKESELKLYKSSGKFEFEEMEFCVADFPLDEKQAFSFLKDTTDRIVIGSSPDIVLVAKIEDAHDTTDPLIHVINEEKILGTAKLSEILKDCSLFEEEMKDEIEKVEERDLTLVGSHGVGKSSIIIQFIANNFIDSYDPTIEDTYRKAFVVYQKAVFTTILDTVPFTEEEIPNRYFLKDGFLNNSGIMYICAINDLYSLESLEDYFKLIFKLKQTNLYPCILCITKYDLPEIEHVITKETVKLFLDKMIVKGYLFKKCPILFNSSKTNLNIYKSFEEIVQECKVDYNIDIFKLVQKVNKYGHKFITNSTTNNSKCLVQ